MKLTIEYDYDPSANPERPFWAYTKYNTEYVWKSGRSWEEAKAAVIETVMARCNSPLPIPPGEEVEI